MTDQDVTADGDAVLNLRDLIRARIDERGWSFSDLERLSEGHLSRGRWHQLASGTRMTQFPEAETLILVADVLQIDVTTVVLAAAASLGVPVRPRGSDLAQLLPAGTDRLSEGTRDAILTIIRATVADTLRPAVTSEEDGPETATLRWPRGETASNTHADVKRT